jgi:S1-C subfamily serine protease
MNALDVIIILMALSALLRGLEIGLVRQVFSTVGFIGGLFLGAYLQQFIVELAVTQTGKSMVTIMTTLGTAVIFLFVGEYIGTRLKSKIEPKLGLNKFDGYFGGILGSLTLLFVAWLGAAIVLSFPLFTTGDMIRGSGIINGMNRSLPPAPNIVSRLGKLIDPNGFPQVFMGREPVQPANTTVPGISSGLQDAIDRSKASVVKMEGIGCGGIVDGTGFVIGSDLVATNAHVVAGVRRPFVTDSNGQHSARAVWFDPDLDFAIVKANNLAGPPLLINNSIAADGTRAAVLGYPGGGPLTAGGAEVLDRFTARGRDIYGESISQRDVYRLAARVIPGNSGGPVIDDDGTVIGVIFAQSTEHDSIGYALTTPQLAAAINQAQAQNRDVLTGSCAQ